MIITEKEIIDFVERLEKCQTPEDELATKETMNLLFINHMFRRDEILRSLLTSLILVYAEAYTINPTFVIMAAARLLSTLKEINDEIITNR